MIYALLLAAVVTNATASPPASHSGVPGCPTGAIGTVLVTKDGISIGGDNVRNVAHGDILVADFTLEHSPAWAVIRVNLKTLEAEAIVGVVQSFNGRFCAFPDPME